MRQVYIHVTILLAIVAGAAYLIRDEGRRARDAIRDAVHDNVPASVEKAADRAVGRAGGLAREAADAAAAVLKTGAKPPAPSASPASPTDPAPIDPAEAIGRLAAAGARVAEGLDRIGQRSLKLTPAEEREAGEAFHDQMLKEHRAVRSPELQARVERLLKPLLEARSRKDLAFTATILDSAEINASSHVGGYLYVNLGLIEHVRTDAELQFVLAHEVAHVDLGHCSRGLTYAVRSSDVLGGLGASVVQQAYRLVALGYSEAQEHEADAWSFRALRSIGRTPAEAISYMERTAAEEPAGRPASPSAGRPDGLAGAAMAAIDGHFASHPPARERLERLRAIADERATATVSISATP
ncbi:MAG: hypothetical protein BGO49_10960 [Planctomycetales bacterium 71-10]|mgnify:FL=1|nr:MAG: hypothetical protein BGO49_10960 [Planctomycetales bacterium 71-10]